MTTKKLSDLIQEEVKNKSETVSETDKTPTVPSNRTRMTKAQLDKPSFRTRKTTSRYVTNSG